MTDDPCDVFINFVVEQFQASPKGLYKAYLSAIDLQGFSPDDLLKSMTTGTL